MTTLPSCSHPQAQRRYDLSGDRERFEIVCVCVYGRLHLISQKELYYFEEFPVVSMVSGEWVTSVDGFVNMISEHITQGVVPVSFRMCAYSAHT